MNIFCNTWSSTRKGAPDSRAELHYRTAPARAFARYSIALFFIFHSAFFILTPAYAQDSPEADDAITEEAPADPCDALSSTVERLRCRNARLFSQPAPTDAQGQSSLALRVGTLIRSFLSVVGILFLMITVYSGIQWMVSGGNEEVLKKTKARITRAAIGLVIVVGSWVITNFILKVAFKGGPQSAPGTYIIPGTGGNVRGFIR